MAEPSAKVHEPCSPVMPISGKVHEPCSPVMPISGKVHEPCSPVYPVSQQADAPEYTWKNDGPEEIVNIDIGEIDDATIACDVYKHLRATETSTRPSTDFLEIVQKDITPRLRAILIDWLSELVDEFRFTQETLYLSVNYLDRYLSGNEVKLDRLQLLGTACVFIAAKYEEDELVPPVQRFCYMTDDTYNEEELLEMESQVLNYLNFEISVPTTECFLKRYIRAAQGSLEVPPLLFLSLASFVAELSLLEYSMVSYKPSMIAASSVLLARSLLQPKKNAWDATLSHYTLYSPSDLFECVQDLHYLLCNSSTSGLDGIRSKYRQHKYAHVAKKFNPFISYSDGSRFWSCKQ